MAHTQRDKNKLVSRVRRIRGQVDGIERLLTENKPCAEVLQLIAGVRGAINGLMGEVVQGHILFHVAAARLTQVQRDEGTVELIDVVRPYLR